MPPPDLVSRFREDLRALAGEAPGPLAVAVSGGPDSLALLLLAHAAQEGRVIAATVDHRLRAENADEARFVADVCAERSIPHTILTADTPLEGASVQAQARALRYRLLSEWAAGQGASHLATAHHLDDQAETILMRLGRGAGLSGLSGIRPSRAEGPVTLIRPLLTWRREELVEIVRAGGIEPVDDPSNRSDAYDRTRARRLVAEHFDAPRLAASASHLREAEDALAWAADKEWQARATSDGEALTLDVRDLLPELLRRLTARALNQLGAEGWRTDKLAYAIAMLRQGRPTTLAGLAITPGPLWRFAPAPPRRTVRQPL